MADAKTTILVVDGDPSVRAVLHRLLDHLGCEVLSASSVAEARALLDRQPVDAAFVDFQLGDGKGTELIRWGLGQSRTRVAFCMLSEGPHSVTARAVEAMRAGSTDVLEKPFDLERLEPLITPLKRPPDSGDIDDWRRTIAPSFIGESPAMLEVLRIVRNVASTRSTVLINGESGTGKEVVARAIHSASKRRARPFVALNCAAIPESLIEAELFGHARGAFTGAVGVREGKVAAADGGTLFLDEIGDMPMAAQAKLLRVLQERAVTPVGADRSNPVDVRIVAATHRDLEGMVEAGTFRLDLYYRINVVPLALPPLRERRQDILPLAHYLLNLCNQETERNLLGFDAGAEEAMHNHSWPGNIRELHNRIERAVIFREEGRLTAKDIQLVDKYGNDRTTVALNTLGENLNLRSALDNVERQFIEQALERTGGNRTEAAALLGLNRTTLVEKIRKFAG